MTEGFVGLGSNLGDRRAYLEAAIQDLATAGIEPVCSSSVWETEPVGAGVGGWFWNMVVRVQTELSAESVLERLLEIEARNGRTRDGDLRPRTLDLDLLVLGDVRLELPRLHLPHPRMWERSFVLAPLAEIAADWVDPWTGRNPRTALAELSDPAKVRCIGSLASAVGAPL
ncbi:MAG: 2-amino-4-hydroxy-6-hydroxymethyldihydropteridine diphosphokinase [Acidobacteriota bacterium]|nr:2-amino-4-hydroxy-6-hydroxymethyldihydropteridine diphosphokinase [Acidobacteriota bacterium]MDH3784271.1 2-amino-4-hydroxy-6-hydroxymethyldihydropteridine diphosphokinase [Acidobacteriota bacterium]